MQTKQSIAWPHPVCMATNTGLPFYLPLSLQVQLYPEAMRGRPDTPPATSLREYHFTILMAELASAYAEGRGQDFADDRFAIDKLLQEEPQHQPLAARFRKLMTLWLQEAHNKKQREEEKERETDEEDEDSNDSDDEGFIKVSKPSKASNESPSSTASTNGQQFSKDGDAVAGTATAARTKSVFDLSGLIDTEDDSSSDEYSSSDEAETARN